MRYFHRSAVSPDDVLDEADRFFGPRLEEVGRDRRMRRFAGTIGTITVLVAAEGGHYTRVIGSTDQVGESEADKLVKRFLATVHSLGEPTHHVRGAY